MMMMMMTTMTIAMIMITIKMMKDLTDIFVFLFFFFEYMSLLCSRPRGGAIQIEPTVTYSQPFKIYLSWKIAS